MGLRGWPYICIYDHSPFLWGSCFLPGFYYGNLWGGSSTSSPEHITAKNVEIQRVDKKGPNYVPSLNFRNKCGPFDSWLSLCFGSWVHLIVVLFVSSNVYGSDFLHRLCLLLWQPLELTCCSAFSASYKCFWIFCGISVHSVLFVFWFSGCEVELCCSRSFMCLLIRVNRSKTWPGLISP